MKGMIAIKKFASIILAAVVLMCCVSVAFAAEVYTCPGCNKKYTTIDEYNNCLAGHDGSSDSEKYPGLHQCPTCGKLFEDLDSYNNCVGSHFNDANYHYDKYVGLTIPELCEALVDIFNESDAMETAQAIVDKSYDVIIKTADSDLVNKELSDLEINLGAIDTDNDIKAEIEQIVDELKNRTESESKTEAEEIETTNAAYPAETGSSTGVGIALFATVSVAMAAAFVTTKKKI